MTTSPATIAAALGHTPEPAQWPGSGQPPVPMARFGKDHWSIYAYLETRMVDHQGVIDHDRMRCSSLRHPWMMIAKTRAILAGSVEGAGYPTIVKGEGPDANGRYGRAEIAGHDDYDCLDDLIAAGLLAVTMPAHREDGFYVDARGRTIRIAGAPLNIAFLTGLAEKHLSAWATWSLTDYGRQVASALRAYKSAGGQFHDFTAPPPAQ